MSVCLLVCLYPINVKTAKPIDPKPYGRCKGDQNPRKKSIKELQLKVKIKDWREAPKKPSAIYSYIDSTFFLAGVLIQPVSGLVPWFELYQDYQTSQYLILNSEPKILRIIYRSKHWQVQSNKC